MYIYSCLLVINIFFFESFVNTITFSFEDLCQDMLSSLKKYIDLL